MSEDQQGRRRGRTKTWLALSALLVLLALLIVPPYISVSRYKNRITQSISASLGRPVRLSSVELRILPRPSFVLTDLVVEEDPACGAEPVLHANSVTAAIRMLPLWRGKLEISRISVDEASLNLVRTSGGRWNLDPFFRTATDRAGAGTASSNNDAPPFPYLEATNSRVNIKNGVEKLPYSLVNADLSFWQETSDEWRIRLRGQPARTDVSLDLADTGIVRLEASLHRASELRKMPVRLDLDWREAQLGQLSRLVLGDDQGWRGDLTGEIHLDGTSDSAKVRTRLRASGVHRAEFAPASPIDFDATCGFLYHYSDVGLENILCESPVGNGRVRLTGGVPGASGSPRLSLELDRVPAQLALDALRTVRSGIDPSLEASGAISGKLTYAKVEELAVSAPSKPVKGSARAAKVHSAPPGPLTGSVNVTGLRLTGDALARPLQVPKITIEPAAGSPPALNIAVPLSEGATAPLNVSARLSLTGYQVSVRGPAILARLRELAHMAGVGNAGLLKTLEGQPALLDLNAEGPWLPAPGPAALPASPSSATEQEAALVPPSGPSDRMTGTLALHNVTWKAGFLANAVEVAAATLRLDENRSRWDPIAFSYGPVRGNATLDLRAHCQAAETCRPQFTVRFDSLDAAALQAAILGARQPGTLLSSLLARLRPSSSTAWPEVEGMVQADSFIVGPVTLRDASANLRILPAGIEIAALDGSFLRGQIHAKGAIVPGDKPAYKLEGQFSKLDAAGLGGLLGMTWSGAALDGSGQVELAGFTDTDLASSAKGSLHFDWRHGSVTDAGTTDAPPALSRFDRWTANAEIANGGITLKENQVQRGLRKTTVDASATFGHPPQVTFTSPDVSAARR